MANKPDLDEPTRLIAERLLSTPPKTHKDMKVGKRKPPIPDAPPEPKKRKTTKPGQ